MLRRMQGPFPYIVLYVALYGAFGAASPFWPKYFETRSLTSENIALLLGAGMLVRLAAGPAVGLLADRLQSLRLMLAVCAAIAALAAVALPSAGSFSLIFLVVLIQAAALAPTTSLADGLSLNAAKLTRTGKRFEYGWIRGSASAAFILGTLTVGQLIGQNDLTPIIWINSALLAAAAAATALLPSDTAQDQSELGALQLPSGAPGLLRIASFRNAIIVSALVFGSHAVHDAFAVIRWSNAGLKPWIISILWSEAVAAEVLVFFLVGPAFLHRVGSRAAACLAAVAGIIRWSIEGLTTSVLPLAMLQPLHGATFALLHLACMHIVTIVVPTSFSATAQTFYAFGGGLATALLTLVSGTLYNRYGGAAFVPMAVLCTIALPFAWFGLAGIERNPRSGPLMLRADPP
jgi:PPP family 3-phenylpropionic acid transporter